MGPVAVLDVSRTYTPMQKAGCLKNVHSVAKGCMSQERTLRCKRLYVSRTYSVAKGCVSQERTLRCKRLYVSRTYTPLQKAVCLKNVHSVAKGCMSQERTLRCKRLDVSRTYTPLQKAVLNAGTPVERSCRFHQRRDWQRFLTANSEASNIGSSIEK